MVGIGRSEYSAMIRTAQRVYGTINNPGSHKTFTPLELLRAHQQSLVQDENFMAFDYSGLARRCRAIIHNVHRIAKGRPGEATKETAGLSSATVAKLVHDTLWEAADLRYSSRNGTARQRTLLAEFAFKISNDPVPDYWTLAARQGSSGHIAEADRPCNKWQWGGNASTSSAPDSATDTKENVDLLTMDRIRNAACAKYREWASQDWSSEQRVRKTELWTDRELRKAGFVHLETKIELMDEYDQILIGLRSTV